MEAQKGKYLAVFGFLLILGLSAYLRLSGITWGIKSGYGHYFNFQPDEFVSMQGVLPINLLAGKIRAPDAYFEGTFNYYLWAVPEMLQEMRGAAHPNVEKKLSAGQFKFILLSGRLMTVTFDLATLVLLFVIIREMTQQSLPALLGALLYGIFPIQVIYSHFMRTHVLVNLLCVLVILLSMKAVKHRHGFLFVATGAVAGLAAATRYPAGVILAIPCLFILFQSHVDNQLLGRRPGKSATYLLLGPFWLIGGGFLLGLFIGHPMLFLDFPNVVHTISFQISSYMSRGAGNPFDLEPIWKYVSVLIPYAAYPMLWAMIYASTLYVVLRRSLWPIVIPLILFAALYAVPMAKGYGVVFDREVMLLLPLFCIFTGLAFGEILPKLVKRPLPLALVMMLILLLISPTILFDWAYGRAMRKVDVRQMLYRDMSELIKNQPFTTIAVGEDGCPFYTAMPAVFRLKSNNVAVELETSTTTPVDFFVMGFERPLAENSLKDWVQRMESRGVFSFVKAYTRVPTVFEKKWDLSDFPPDMTYPFPTLLLFRKATTAKDF
jgi:hypothetical protein